VPHDLDRPRGADPDGIEAVLDELGPVDTGWPTPELRAKVADRFPGGRWSEPDDAARLITWLVSDDGRWVTGQILNSEGGFRR
jgi:3-oxoacyl-[acyl-carrier protein] reductase